MAKSTKTPENATATQTGASPEVPPDVTLEGARADIEADLLKMRGERVIAAAVQPVETELGRVLAAIAKEEADLVARGAKLYQKLDQYDTGLQALVSQRAVFRVLSDSEAMKNFAASFGTDAAGLDSAFKAIASKVTTASSEQDGHLKTVDEKARAMEEARKKVDDEKKNLKKVEERLGTLYQSAVKKAADIGKKLKAAESALAAGDQERALVDYTDARRLFEASEEGGEKPAPEAPGESNEKGDGERKSELQLLVEMMDQAEADQRLTVESFKVAWEGAVEAYRKAFAEWVRAVHEWGEAKRKLAEWDAQHGGRLEHRYRDLGKAGRDALKPATGSTPPPQQAPARSGSSSDVYPVGDVSSD